MNKTSITVLSVFSIFLIWILAYVVVGSPLLLPSPVTVAVAFANLFVVKASLLAILATIGRLLVALLVAFVFGILLGVLSGFFPGFATYCRPIVTILRTIPVISIIVILLILFGFKITPYIITFLMIFPIMYQAVYEGIINIDPELVDVYKLEDNRFFTGLRYCYIPLTRHEIKTALLQSAGLGIKVLVMSEYLAQTRTSIGNQLYLAKVNFRYDEVFAWTIFLILLAVVLEIFIQKAIRHREQKTSRSPSPSRSNPN